MDMEYAELQGIQLHSPRILLARPPVSRRGSLVPKYEKEMDSISHQPRKVYQASVHHHLLSSKTEPPSAPSSPS